MIKFFKTDETTKRCFKLNMAKGWGYFKIDSDDVDKGWGFLFYYFGFVVTTKIKKIFIICPVRRINEDQRKEIDKYIKQKKREGFSVHSYKNVNQVDPTGGVNICAHHRKAMKECDEVHVFFDASSSGSHFDFGMAFALDKPIKLIKVYQPTPVGKSYQAVLEKITISGM